MSEYLAAAVWPAYVAAAISVALAVWLVRVDWRRVAHRRFALYLVLASGQAVLFSLVQASSDVAMARYLLSVWVYWSLGSLVTLLWFAVAYARPHPVVAYSLQVVSGVLAAVTLLVFVTSRASFWTLGTYGTDVGIRAGPAVFAGGPMISLFLVLRASLLVALGMLTRHFVTAPVGRARGSAYVITLGLLVPATYASARVWGIVAFEYQSLVVQQGVAPWFIGLQLALDGALGLAMVVGASWFLSRGEPGKERGARRWAVGVAAAVGALAAGLSVFGYRGPISGLMDGAVALALPVLATYGILRHQLFDLDVTARLTVKASTLAGIFLAVGFAATEASTEFVGETVGSTYIGIAATALLVFAFAPLQRLAERIAHAAVPEAKRVVAMDADEKALAYAEVVRMAWLDGRLTAAERRAMDAARGRLGLSLEDAHRVEQATMAELS